jgi:hypothetical protein
VLDKVSGGKMAWRAFEAGAPIYHPFMTTTLSQARPQFPAVPACATS